jgi:stringent starvation protein B
MMDNGLTPYIQVRVDSSVLVPHEFVQDGEIVLNISTEATGGLHLGNEEIRFQARFSGRVRDISVPITRIVAIFARENGQGMVFEESAFDSVMDDFESDASIQPEQGQPSKPAGSGLSLVEKTSATSAAQDKTASTNDTPPPTPPKGGSSLRVVK